MASPHDLLELSRHLKQERLFISSEREQLQCLNEDVTKAAEKLYHLSWVARQQKRVLDRLILADREVTPAVCCRRSNALEASTFVDGYKHLSYHESKFGEFLKHMREHPRLMAACLINGERASVEEMQTMARIIMASLYGNVVMPEDEHHALQLLRALVELQLATSDNPRRLLRKGSCAFSVVFKLFTEGLFSSKLFLTAALHKPVMQLLMEDEWFYDIDPQRALDRFPPQEKVKRFSNPGTEEYELRTKQYREITTNKLVSLAERFINSIKENIYCFPQSLGWLVAHLYVTVRKAQRVSAAEARAMCADLIFALFICPAICDPEPVGITSDAPISYIARHNLMQVAQILQVLAISTWEEIDPKLRDVYGKFGRNCMSSLLDSLLESGPVDQLMPPTVQLPGCSRAVILITFQQLLDMIQFLRGQCNHQDISSDTKKQLEEMLSWLPPQATLQNLMPTPTTTPQPTPPGTPPVNKREKSHGLKKERRRLMLTPDVTHDDPDDGTPAPAQPEEVLVVSLGVVNDCPGMLSENKVLEQDTRQRKVRYNNLSAQVEEEGASGPELPLQEKRTRFSLSHDQDSIATSDNLEAISEAASSHSPVGSDIETENDNLSDMVSANVSGRGTPNISGRDTPISQAGSAAESVEEPRRAPDLPVIVQKTNREDVTERFGKFEIKAELERDETKSTVSDTWSTDVLAGDSEPPEQNQMERLEEVAEEVISQNLLAVQEILEVSETASDAWSTDVLASDTSEKQAERLLELDQDETASVSSRSQGPESEAGDPQEDTPQPSGSQSPNEGVGMGRHDLRGPDMTGLGRHPVFGSGVEGMVPGRHHHHHHPYGTGALGGSPDSFPPPADFYNGRPSHEGRGLPHPRPQPSFNGQPAHRPDRIASCDSAAAFNGGVGGREGGAPERRAVSEMVCGFNYMEQTKLQSMGPPQRPTSASFKYTENKVSTVLQAFDPLAPPPLSSSSTSSRRPQDTSPAASDTSKALVKGSSGSAGGSSTLGSSTQTLVPDSLLISPDQGIASPGGGGSGSGGSISIGGGSVSPHADRRDRDSGVPPTPQDPAESPAMEGTDGLKLTEQQNVNIDANRLSGLSGVLNFLDPLLPDGDSFMTRSRSSTEGSGIALLRNNPLTRLLFQDQAPAPSGPARPRATSATAIPGATPRIAFMSGDGERERQNGGGGRREKIVSAPDVIPSRGGVFDTGSTVSDRTDTSGLSRSSESAPHDDEKRLSDGSNISGGDFISKSRSSTESSCSSLVDTAAVGSGSGSGSVKTVGFDTPSREERDEDDKNQDGKKKTSFFRTFKERLSKGGRRKPSKQFDRDDKQNPDGGGAGDLHRPISDVNGVDDILNKYKSSAMQRPTADGSGETSDDILAKYRKQPPTSSASGAAGSAQEGGALVGAGVGGRGEKTDSGRARRVSGGGGAGVGGDETDEGPPAYDPSSLETCKAFLDAKRKLRLVLSTADFQSHPLVGAISLGGGFGPAAAAAAAASAAVTTGIPRPPTNHNNNIRQDHELISFLRVQLAEAINLQDKDLIAQLHETIRCLRQFDNDGMQKLLRIMRDEYKSRAPYIAYLVRCRQGLLSTLAHIERLLNRVKRDKAVCNKYFLSVFIRLFLEKRERALIRFIADFQKLTVSDEKTDLVEHFLEYLNKQMEQDPMWQAASDSQMNDARIFIERNIMSHIYTHAMFPNGDGDILRDQILHDHMAKLSEVITVNHKDLRVARVYHYECPWPAAQAEIYMINAYKTPKDKLQCVLRCSSTIMNLLSMANEKSVPAADDFMPVLIYVLIKANPQSLLSTIQYVTSFYEKRLQGEEQYWWMQFCSAIEFIKTMDYGD